MVPPFAAAGAPPASSELSLSTLSTPEDSSFSSESAAAAAAAAALTPTSTGPAADPLTRVCLGLDVRICSRGLCGVCPALVASAAATWTLRWPAALAAAAVAAAAAASVAAAAAGEVSRFALPCSAAGSADVITAAKSAASAAVGCRRREPGTIVSLPFSTTIKYPGFTVFSRSKVTLQSTPRWLRISC